MRQTTAQLIINKFDELRWIEFCIWLNDNRELVAKHNKDDIEYSHFNGALKSQSSADYYRNTYNPYLDKVVITRVWSNGGWLNRLIYNKKVIGDFISFEEAMHFVESNYDRATDTIKENKTT